VASAIRIGNPASWQLAECARDESGGAIDSVSDEQILEAYGLMASREGIFCEPASAASMAGLMKLASQGEDLRDKTVVCVITGTGLKDPDLAMTQTKTVLQETAPDLKSVLSVLGRSA
jgi:threonine synthase